MVVEESHFSKPLEKEGWEKVICIASGPSLTKEQIGIVDELRNKNGYKVIAVSNNYQLAPWVDAVYSADHSWWHHYYPSVRDLVYEHTELWTQERVVKSAKESWKRWGFKLSKPFNGVKLAHGKGIGRVDTVHHNGNSGCMAVNLAYLFGAKEIILVGYDFGHTFGKRHWFGDHDKKKFRRNADNPETWVRSFRYVCEDLLASGVTVKNATLHTAIPNNNLCPHITLEELL